MDLTNQQIKDTYGNVLTIGATAGSPQTGTLQNGEGLNITSATLTGGTVTTSNPLLDMTQTWNDAGVTFTSLKLNVTDTASLAGSLLMDLQVGGSSKIKIDKGGQIFLPTGGGDASGLITGGSAFTNARSYIGQYGLRLANILSLQWSSGTNLQTLDLSLFRDAANVLGQRTGTNAQTFSIYNTYTDGSNFERGFLQWNSNTLVIGTYSLGTGTDRSISLRNCSEIRMSGDADQKLSFSAAGYFAFIDNAGNEVVRYGGFMSVTPTFSINWASSAGSIGGTKDLGIARSASGVIKVTDGSTGGGSLEMLEQTAPSAPSADAVRIYAEDNGSGKTRLMALFATGAAQQIAIEP